MAASEESKDNDINYESPVDIFSLFAQENHYKTTSNAWKSISGCYKEVAVGGIPVFCEIIGVGTGHNAKSNGGAIDFGININGKIHEGAEEKD